MTLKFNASLATALQATSSQVAWGTLLKTQFTNRRLCCYRDPAQGAANPAVTGTKFLDIGLTGEMTIVGDAVTNFGSFTDTSTRLAADLSTGTCVLRIESGTNWIEGTLGLSAAAQLASGVQQANVKTYDFTLSGSPTLSSGFQFSTTAKLKAPKNKVLGTIPDPNPDPVPVPAGTISIELEDWTGNTPTIVATANLTRRLQDWVFEDAEMAAEIGPVAMYTVDETIKWTTPHATQRFELGALLMVASDYNTEDGDVQLEQILCSFKPLGRWATYPFMDTYERAHYPYLSPEPWPGTWGECDNAETADLTYPPPFKINLKRNGVIIHTHEIKAFNDEPSGPINGPQWSQALTRDDPLIPHFNCAMMLPWQNVRTKRSANAGKYFPGVSNYGYSNNAAAFPASSNACIPFLGAYAQINGANNFYWMPAYPMRETILHDTYPGTSTPNPGKAADIAYLDAYDDSPVPTSQPNRRTYDPQLFRTTGHKWQPASITGHDWRTGNGGVRFDRNVIPHVLAIWAGDPIWTRPLGNVPIRDMVEDWGLAYFNHSNHWIRDLLTFESLPKDATERGDMVIAGGYYGSGPYGALGESRGPQYTVDICGVGNGSHRLATHSDQTGRMPYGGWQRDILHAYTNAGWHSLLLNSPMHALAAGHDYHTIWMTALGNSYPTTDPTGNFFMIREHAWRWLAYTMQWKLATQHSAGFSRQEVEARFQVELETMYDMVYKRTFIDNNPHPYFKGVRALGVGIKVNQWGHLEAGGGNMALYLGPVMMAMKQFGCLAAMRSKSAKCATVFDMVFDCLDKMTIDYCMDTDMRDAYYPLLCLNVGELTLEKVPDSWAAQKTYLDANLPPTNPGDFVNFTQKVNGSYGEQEGAAHMYIQYMKMRKVYFPEYPHARLDAAIAKMEAYYTAHDTQRQTFTGHWDYMYPSYSEILAPSELGPI